MVNSFRSELAMMSIDVSMSTLILGMIRTESNSVRGDTLRDRAMPVAECASEMVCAIDGRYATSYIPQVWCGVVWCI